MVVGAAVVPLGGLVVERRLPADVPGGHAIDRAHRTADAAGIDPAHRAAGTGGHDVAPARGEAGALSS